MTITIPRPGSRAGPCAGAERLQLTVCFDVQVTAFGDFQLEIYLAGLQGVLPSFPMAFAELEARAERALPPSVLSVELFGMTLPSPLLMAPIGVIGLCAQDGHGDLATADAAARTGVPMIASTLSADPLEDVAPRFGDTPASSSC